MTFTFLFSPISTGVHHGRVLSADVGGQKTDVRGSGGDLEVEQLDGDEGVDSRHVLQERKEIGGSQHDGSQQAFPHHEKRHDSLHHEVRTSLNPV